MRIIRKGIDLSVGLNGTPRFCINGSNNVLVQGAGVVGVGDDYFQTHNLPHHHPHPMGIASTGSPNVRVNDKPVHRNGDLIACGDIAGNGSTTVFCN